MSAPPLLARAVATLLVLGACDSSQPPIEPPSPGAVASVVIAPATAHLLPGNQLALSATPRDASRNHLDRPVTWSSSDPSKATVSEAGVVTAVGAGSVVITAESDDIAGEAVIAVDEGGVIGPEGGEVRAFGGQVVLTVPAGAFAVPASVFVTRPPAAPLDATSAAEPVHLRSTQAFATPAMLTLAYDLTDAPAGVDESALGMRSLLLSGWVTASGATIDPATHRASVPVSADGTFGVGRIPPTVPCTAPEFRQFDFWLGGWNVAPSDAPPDARQASSTITAEPGGCAIFEDFHDLDVHGVSISLYDPATAKWYQTFIDNAGGRLVLSGGLVSGSMVLAGSGNVNRITWESLTGGVRQFGEDSRDGGATWSTTFDLLYRR